MLSLSVSIIPLQATGINNSPYITCDVDAYYEKNKPIPSSLSSCNWSQTIMFVKLFISIHIKSDHKTN